MARGNDTLTPRQRQSQRIMREKATRKKRQAFLRKFALAGGCACAVLLTGFSVWAWKSGAAVRAAQSVSDSAYAATIRMGFSLQSLYLDGRNRTPLAEIEQALGVKKGEPILRLSLSDMRERLEKIESVRFAAVERVLPGALYVHIVEREPVALWQHEGKLALVDDNGVVMTGLDIAPYRNLPLIVGDGAPKNVSELLGLLASDPSLAKEFAAAVRVGERRWNIRLKDGVEVKLPESDPGAAWKKLAELSAKQQLLERDVKVIDLRLQGRLFIRMAPQALPTKASGAKET